MRKAVQRKSIAKEVWNTRVNALARREEEEEVNIPRDEGEVRPLLLLLLLLLTPQRQVQCSEWTMALAPAKEWSHNASLPVGKGA